MTSLMYISSATLRPSRDQLVNLLECCHTNNEKVNVTGLLLYNGLGTYLQILEGDSCVVEALFEKIKKDSRHKRVNLLSQDITDKRSFPDWKMGFRDLRNVPIDDIPNFSPFMQNTTAIESLQKDTRLAYKMLLHFKNMTEELVF